MLSNVTTVNHVIACMNILSGLSCFEDFLLLLIEPICAINHDAILWAVVVSIKVFKRDRMTFNMSIIFRIYLAKLDTFRQVVCYWFQVFLRVDVNKLLLVALIRILYTFTDQVHLFCSFRWQRPTNQFVGNFRPVCGNEDFILVLSNLRKVFHCAGIQRRLTIIITKKVLLNSWYFSAQQMLLG